MYLWFGCLAVLLDNGLSDFRFVVGFVCVSVLFHWFTAVSGQVIKVTVHFCCRGERPKPRTREVSTCMVYCTFWLHTRPIILAKHTGLYLAWEGELWLSFNVTHAKTHRDTSTCRHTESWLMVSTTYYMVEWANELILLNGAELQKRK